VGLLQAALEAAAGAVLGLELRDSLIMGALVGDMVLRKHPLYPEDLRLVGEWELRHLGDGEVLLRAVGLIKPTVAHPLPEK
jgi:hypothetical protein